MGIIVFLVDNSASMNQKAYVNGGYPTLLDVSKNIVEMFIKIRQRNIESRTDRYMLLTFADYPNNVKAGWKENLSTFMNELKSLQATELTTCGSALRNTFDVLNLNRIQTGIDTYGQGRCPFYLEPAIIILITDGGKLTSKFGLADKIVLPTNSFVPGSELTKELFRWDQRLFSLVLRLPATFVSDHDSTPFLLNDNSSIDAICEATGGRSYSITSYRMINQCVDSLIQKLQNGVIIHFERVETTQQQIETIRENDTHDTKEQNVNWWSCKKMIFVPRSEKKGYAVGFWPIPESFWPENNLEILPQRSAHPKIQFSCIDQDPIILENFPFDRYELEPSMLTQQILSRKQPLTCWQVFVPNSYKKSEITHPFGYLKASSNLRSVNLFIMPYNYPVLLPLLCQLVSDNLKPTPEWTQQFGNYLQTVPSYYNGPLRRALTLLGLPNTTIQMLIPGTFETSLNATILNYLIRIKNQAKIKYDRLCNDVLARQNAQKISQSTIPVDMKISPTDMIRHPTLQNNQLATFEQCNNSEFNAYRIGIDSGKINMLTKNFGNCFNIPRRNIIKQNILMRANFFQPLNRIRYLNVDDVNHTLPISQMGNYQEYLKNVSKPLRQIELSPIRQHIFGNPFKTNKRSIKMVDETETEMNFEMADHLATANVIQTKKRKPGPIPRDFVFHRPHITTKIFHPHEETIQKTENDENQTPNLIFNATKNEDIILHNKKLKKVLFADVRKPGKKCKTIFDNLLLLRGTCIEQGLIIKEVYNEALRFKRKKLACDISAFVSENDLTKQ